MRLRKRNLERESEHHLQWWWWWSWWWMRKIFGLCVWIERQAMLTNIEEVCLNGERKKNEEHSHSHSMRRPSLFLSIYSKGGQLGPIMMRGGFFKASSSSSFSSRGFLIWARVGFLSLAFLIHHQHLRTSFLQAGLRSLSLSVFNSSFLNNNNINPSKEEEAGENCYKVDRLLLSPTNSHAKYETPIIIYRSINKTHR